MKTRNVIKGVLGSLPYTAEMYWLMTNRENKAYNRFNLDKLQKHLPDLVLYLKSQFPQPNGKKVFLFASLHFWINHTMITGLALSGMGYDVTLGYLPYSDFSKPITNFDLRRNDMYARKILGKAAPFLKAIPFLDIDSEKSLPGNLKAAIDQITTFDTRYILQVEDVSGNEPIYHLRYERNKAAAGRAMAYFNQNRPDAVVVPNGMIQEFGAVYEVAKHLNIPVVTYEFGEQDQRIWIGQDRWVIHHQLDELWQDSKERILNMEQRNWLESFLKDRQVLNAGNQFAHLWQNTDRAGGDIIREKLNLDMRPVILIPTNVLGDSATLGLSLFTGSMTEWLKKVLPILAKRSDVQVVIRIHPGEILTVGPSVKEIIRGVLPILPGHIHLIEPIQKINTYDLMDIANLALVYTTTAGLEMALRGIPVLVCGRAHYRKKGFTVDSDSWDEFVSNLEIALDSIPYRMEKNQVEKAWNYAYTFFAEYPKPFPWHLEKLWPSLELHPLSEVLSPAGQKKYAATFLELAGDIY